MTSKSGRALEVFTEAVHLPIEERVAFLEQACAGDEDLRQKVGALLRSNDRVGQFMEEPPTGSISQGRAKVAAGEEPGDRVGRYRLVQRIGEGGCGVVFEAEQEEPIRRRVALKVVKPGMDTKSVIARFEAERQALALMDHPNIAHVFDAGATESGRPYFVMELVRGIRITDYCDQHNLTTAGRLDLFIQVCHAVQHAHQKGIIHRDIKPSNVLVTSSEDGRAQPMVIDFGIAKATTGQQLTDNTVFTAFEMLIGTPAYMSPEQAELKSVDVDTRSDIYSLGVLLYELLTGTTPFDSRELLKAGLDEVRRVIREQEPVRPSTRLSTMIQADLAGVSRHRQAEPPRLIREVRGELDWIVMTALEKDRARRYQTANAFAEDIQHYLENEVVSARPPSRIYKFRKLVSRHKLGFAALGIVMATLIAGLSVTTWSFGKEKRARKDAEVARGEANDQRKKAEKGEQNALNEAARSQQVTEVLKDMLHDFDPVRARGRDTTAMLRQTLDKTLKRIGLELTNQPTVQADLKLTLGGVYGTLGLDDKGEPLMREALAYYRKSPADFEQKISDALATLSLLHMRQSKFEEAEQEMRESLNWETNRSPKATMRRVVRETWLAWAISKRGRAAEAEAIFRKALGTGQRLVGGQSEQLLDTRAGLATALTQLNKLDDAETLLRESLSVGGKKLGADHPYVANDMFRLALVLDRKGKLAEAEDLHRQCVAIRRKMLGTDHPLFDEALTALAGVLRRARKQTEAAVVYGELMEIRRKQLGDKHSRVEESVTELARVLVGSHNEVQFEQLARDFPKTWITRSEDSARRGRWSESMAAAARFLQVQPGEYRGYYHAAPLLVQIGDRAAYEDLCAKITTLFVGTTNPVTADRMAKACLMLPQPDLDLKLVSELAATAVAAGQKDRASQCTMALAEYRQGHWDGATDWALKAAENPSPYFRAEAYAILAMAQYHSKQTEASRTSLKKCTEIVQTELPKLEGGDLGKDWRGWIIAHALQLEAKALIEGNSSSSARSADLQR